MRLWCHSWKWLKMLCLGAGEAAGIDAGRMHGRLVPAIGTNVEFTSKRGEHNLRLSSSGGGLFGRLMTRKSCGTLLNFGGAFVRANSAAILKYSLGVAPTFAPKRTRALHLRQLRYYSSQQPVCGLRLGPSEALSAVDSGLLSRGQRPTG
jgi:hypothetical protein